jgi:hypothetical protein
MGISLLDGRDFDSTDQENSEQVVILNNFLARELWSGQNAIGKAAYFDGNPQHSCRVIGVAADSKYETLGEGPAGFVYRPATQYYSPHINLVLRTAGPPLPTPMLSANWWRNLIPTSPSPVFGLWATL